jgi:hypothetical protein
LVTPFKSIWVFNRYTVTRKLSVSLCVFVRRFTGDVINKTLYDKTFYMMKTFIDKTFI